MSNNPQDFLRVPGEDNEDTQSHTSSTRPSSAHSSGGDSLRGGRSGSRGSGGGSRGSSASRSDRVLSGRIRKQTGESGSSQPPEQAKQVVIFGPNKTYFASTVGNARELMLHNSKHWMTKQLARSREGHGVVSGNLKTEDKEKVRLREMTWAETAAVESEYPDGSGWNKWHPNQSKSDGLWSISSLQLSNNRILPDEPSMTGKREPRLRSTTITLFFVDRPENPSPKFEPSRIYLASSKQKASSFLGHGTEVPVTAALRATKDGKKLCPDHTGDKERVWYGTLTADQSVKVDKLRKDGKKVWDMWIPYDKLPDGFPDSLSAEAMSTVIAEHLK